MSAAVHCDRPGCDTWTSGRTASDHGFLRVTWCGISYDLCSTDCLLRFFAHVEPMTRIEA